MKTRHVISSAVSFAALLLSPSALAADAAFPVLLSPEQFAACEGEAYLVDVRSEADFTARRIPGAIHLPAGAFQETRDGVPGMLPASDTLRKTLAERGIATDKPVVVYGANRSARDIFAVTRVFWALEYLGYPEVAILDGGLSRWESENRETASGARETPRASAAVEEQPDAGRGLAEKSDVAQTLESANGAVLVDARSAGHYSGATPVRGARRNGHIPGARNIPFSEAFATPHFVYKTPDELAPLLYGDDITRDTEIIVYCNSGASSSVLYFAYRLMGHERIANYDGSMFEWAADESLPVIRSAAP